MRNLTLNSLEKEASSASLLLRIQVRRPLSIWTFKVVVAEKVQLNKVQLLGELKGWAYRDIKGLQIDTIKVSSPKIKGVGDLLWAATMLWAMESTPCKYARLLAISDENFQHYRLIRYFQQKGFNRTREVGSSPLDLPLRMVWGGSGSLMIAECENVLEKSYLKWQKALALK